MPAEESPSDANRPDVGRKRSFNGSKWVGPRGDAFTSERTESPPRLPPEYTDPNATLVESLADYDDRLRKGDPAFDGGIIGDDETDIELIGAKACVTFLERAFARNGDVPARPKPGHQDRIGRFELIRILGQGGFGVVYLARDPRLGRVLALKVPRLHTLGDSRLQERFLREARAAASLDHPNIAPILETGEVGPVCYIASAYCEGADLAQWLKANAPVESRFAARMVATLAAATHYSHTHGILHRDLKPSNVLLAPPSEASGSLEDELPFVLRLTDFGLAKFAEESLGETGSAILGTPMYMSPEQAAGRSEDVTAATDVYALGAILYELLTGRPPFQGAAFAEVLDQIRSSDPVSPSRLVRSVPRDLETICLKCLEKLPARRYATAAALRNDLYAFLEGSTIAARPAGRIETTVKWFRRRPLAASLVAVVSVAVLIVFALQWNHTRELVAHVSTAENLRAESEAREAELRLRFSIAEINAAGLDLSAGNFDRAEARLAPLKEAAAGRPTPAVGIESEWKFVLHQLDGPQPERVFSENEGPVYSLAVSPDGRLVAAGNKQGTIKVRRVDKGTEVASFPAHEGEVRALAFSPNGERLASGGQFQHLKLWDTADWRLVQTCAAHDGTITCLDWRHDGGRLASGGRDGKIRMWNSADLTSTRAMDVGAVVNRVRFTTDGSRLFFTDKANRISQWSLDSEEPRRVEICPTEHNPLALALSHSGEFGITGYGDFFAYDGRLARTASGIEVAAATIAPIGNWAATEGREGEIDLWRWADTPLESYSQQSWRGHDRQGMVDFAATPDGSRLITAGLDGLIKIWRIADCGHPTRYWLRGHSHAVRGVAFSVDDRMAASAGEDGRIRVYETETGRMVGTLDLAAKGSKFGKLGFAPDGQTLFVQANAPRPGLVVWRFGSSNSHTFTETPPIHDVAISADGSRLALALTDNQGVVVRETSQLEIVHSFVDSSLEVTRLEFSPDGRILAIATGAGPRNVYLLDLETGSRQTITGTTGRVEAMAFDRSGERLATIGKASALQLIDVSTAQVADSLYTGATSQTRNGVCFSPDGEVIAVGLQGPGGIHGIGELWHLAARRPVLSLHPHAFGIGMVQYSHDGRFLAASTPAADKYGQAGLILWRFDPPRAPRPVSPQVMLATPR